MDANSVPSVQKINAEIANKFPNMAGYLPTEPKKVDVENGLLHYQTGGARYSIEVICQNGSCTCHIRDFKQGNRIINTASKGSLGDKLGQLAEEWEKQVSPLLSS